MRAFRPSPFAVLSACTLVAALILGYAFLSERGSARAGRQTAEARALGEDVRALEAENHALRAEIRLLRGEEPGSAAYLEKTIRQELGYIRPSEQLLLLRPAEEGAP